MKKVLFFVLICIGIVSLCNAQIDSAALWVDVAQTTANITTRGTLVSHPDGYVTIYPLNGGVYINAVGVTPSIYSPQVTTNQSVRFGYKVSTDKIILSAVTATTDISIITSRYRKGIQ